ncbi:MFS general substrate transporter [Polychaeton citri CBS 116435]|uniref:MFS general substrate transporter n=1 Tax=Polychaeton citri CBS 116435 TaxID=1314669 RepID=A0A9P4QGX2_9PEZI|nr:MFS general substrate transporter [Polychaeton citri CBS 116435]
MSVQEFAHGHERTEPPSLHLNSSNLDIESHVEAEPDEKGEDSTTTITWDSPHDPGNPYNWPPTRKWLVTGTALLGTLVVTLNGTSITVAADAINGQFNVSDASFPNSYWPVFSWSLGGGLFIILFLPLMEDLGIRKGFLIFYVFFFLMVIPQAVAQNFATLIVTRFFAGGCVALLANTIASIIPDVFESDEERSIPVGLYIMLYLVGSTLGPPMFAGVEQHLDTWRWIFYIQLIIYGSLFPVFFFMIRETRSAVILRQRAKKLRKTSNKLIRTKSEINGIPFRTKLWRSTTRPLLLLFTEPVLFASTLWSAFSFGTVYLFSQSVEQVFAELYGWRGYSTGYVQGAVVIGELLGWLATIYNSKLYLKSARRNNEMPGRPIPEARLYVSVFGSFFGITGGMFVYAWTSYPSLPWIAPAIGLAMVGFGIMTVVTAVADYVTDAYAASDYAGSAISAVAFGENLVAGTLPLATGRIYTQLGFQWASTLLGLLAFVLSLAPVVFLWKGTSLRARSPFMLSAGRETKVQV